MRRAGSLPANPDYLPLGLAGRGGMANKIDTTALSGSGPFVT